MTGLAELLQQVKAVGVVICALLCAVLGVAIGCLWRLERIERHGVEVVTWVRERRERRKKFEEQRRERRCGTGSTRTPGASVR